MEESQVRLDILRKIWCTEFVEQDVMRFIAKVPDEKKFRDDSKKFFERKGEEKSTDEELLQAYLQVYIRAGLIHSPDELLSFINDREILRKRIVGKQRENVLAYLERKAKSIPERFSIRTAKDACWSIIAEMKAESEKEDALDELDKEIDKRQEIIAEQHEEIARSQEELGKIQRQFEGIEAITEQEADEELDKVTTPAEQTYEEIWWKERGFVADPFPGQNLGLWEAVDRRFLDEKQVTTEEREAFFDKVLVKTALVTEFDSLMRSSPHDFLGNTFLIIGEFGCGKSVLFEHIQIQATRNGIICISVNLNCTKDIERLIREFYREILTNRQLRRRYREAIGIELSNRVASYDRDQIAEVLSELKEREQLMGVLILIDGLHKFEEMTREALQFIAALQNFAEYLYKADIRTSFMIAGSRIWLPEIKLNAVQSGSISERNVKLISEVTAVQAHEMFNKRLLAFSKEKKNYTHIPKERIENIRSVLKSRHPRDLTFRDYIDECIPWLKSGDSTKIFINPLYARSTLENIYAHLEDQHRSLCKKLNYLKDFFKRRPENSLKVVEVLANMPGFLAYDDTAYKNNMIPIRTLKQFELIQAAALVGKPGIRPSEDYRLANIDIQKKFGYEMSHILVEVFKAKIIGQTPPPRNHVEETPLKNILIQHAHLRPKFQEIFNSADESYLSVMDQDILDHRTLDRCKESCRLLVSSIFTLLGDVDNNQATFDELNRRMLAPEYDWLLERASDYEEFYNKVFALEKKGAIADKLMYAEVAAVFKRAYQRLSALIQELVLCEYVAPIARPSLLLRDMAQIHRMRLALVKEDYSVAVQLLGEFYEEKMRQNLYAILRTKYGDKWKRRLSQELNDQIRKNEEKGNRSLLFIPPEQNVLYDADRTAYGYIILDKIDDQNSKTNNWPEVFQPIFIDREVSATHVKTIHPFITGDAHHWPKSRWELNKGALKNAIEYVAILAEKLNLAYLKLFSPTSIYLKDIEEEGPSTEIRTIKKQIFFSTMNLQDQDRLFPIRFEVTTYEALWKQLTRSLQNVNRLEVSFEDPKFTLIDLQCSFRDLAGLLACAIKEGKLELELTAHRFYIRRVTASRLSAFDLN